jgi:isopenicillin N synthase-like dioxygenase
MARGLRLDDSFFVDRYSGNPVTSLRIREYPVSGTRVDAVAGRGLLTIVKLGESAGQQVFFDGQWIDVPALPGALLCYVGPVLERLTHGHYVSAAHRLSPGDARNRPSLSFEFEPASDAVLAPVVAVRPRSGGWTERPVTAMPWRPAADSSRHRPG